MGFLDKFKEKLKDTAEKGVEKGVDLGKKGIEKGTELGTKGYEGAKEAAKKGYDKAKEESPPKNSVKQDSSKQSFEDPLKVLKLRYAKGEISKEEFEEMKKTLE